MLALTVPQPGDELFKSNQDARNRIRFPHAPRHFVIRSLLNRRLQTVQELRGERSPFLLRQLRRFHHDLLQFHNQGILGDRLSLVGNFDFARVRS